MASKETRIEDLLDSEQAVQYLAKKWKMESYSKGAFRALRFRLNHETDLNIQPVLATKTATFWRKSDLDRIPKPDRTQPRGPRAKKNNDEGDDTEGRIPSVMLTASSLVGAA